MLSPAYTAPAFCVYVNRTEKTDTVPYETARQDTIMDIGPNILAPAEGARKSGAPLFLVSVAAGFPSPAEDYLDGRLDLNEYLIKHRAATFFLRAAGDSMTGAGIRHGDILIVDRALDPADGDIVIAALEGELTVKRIRKSGGELMLMPENAQYKPVRVTEEMDVSVWGVVTAVIHSFR